MRYAINLGDLMAFQRTWPLIYSVTVRPRLTGESATVDRAAIDGEAAVLDDDERSEAVVDLLQKRMGKNRMRAYRQWDGSRKWERI